MMHHQLDPSQRAHALISRKTPTRSMPLAAAAAAMTSWAGFNFLNTHMVMQLFDLRQKLDKFQAKMGQILNKIDNEMV